MKVAFVYAGGRLGRDAQGPSDFFYGARELAGRAGWEVVPVEVDAGSADPLTGFLGGRLLRHYLPPRTTADWLARSRRVLNRLRGCDAVVATATEISFGLAFWKSLGRLSSPMAGILCGAVNYPLHSGVRRRLAQRLLRVMRPVLFAAAEREELVERFGLPPDHVNVGWFGVDEKFWAPPAESAVRRGVLAVGNDGRRDFDTLLASADELPGEEFTILTKREPPDRLPQNVHWRRGDWREEAVSDDDLRRLYQTAACVVVPLHESIQPSGQSVAMQAMMCGAPVVHTKTAGWWGADVIRDGREVALVPPGSATALVKAVRRALVEGASSDSRQALLAAEWTAAGFAERLAAVIEGGMQTQFLDSRRV